MRKPERLCSPGRCGCGLLPDGGTRTARSLVEGLRGRINVMEPHPRARVNAFWPPRQGLVLDGAGGLEESSPGVEALPSIHVTIVDVATRAGVGVATVSRVLNGHANVRPTAREPR